MDDLALPPFMETPQLDILEPSHIAAKRPKKWHTLLPESVPSRAQQPARSPHHVTAENDETIVLQHGLTEFHLKHWGEKNTL